MTTRRSGRKLVRALAAPVEARTSADRWLVSYADLLTLLFALFAVLVALSHQHPQLQGVSASISAQLAGRSGQAKPLSTVATNAKAPGKPAAGSMPSAATLAAQLRQVLSDTPGGSAASVEESPSGLVLSFPEAGLFPSGGAQLLAGTGDGIVAVGKVLAARGASLRVEGHSDDQPIANTLYHSNWELSAARAMAVLTLLVSKADYDPTHLAMAGYGPYRPVADNSTPEGRRMNRRVNLVVLLDAQAEGTGSGATKSVPGSARP